MSNVLESSESISYRLIVFVSIFTPLQVVLVGLRFYARSLTTSKWGCDDWLIIASLLGQFVAAGIAIGGIKDAAFGHHIGYVEKTNPEAIVNLFKYLVAIPVWYHFTISLAKLAICFLYHRLFPQRYIRIALYITMGIMIGTAVGSIFADFLVCWPFEANWAPLAVQATKCADKEALYVWSTLPNIITDVILLVLPIPVIWNLQVNGRLKVALGVTFFFGSIGLVASILRFVAFANHNSFVDATYTAVELVIWTVAEPGIYLTAACLMMYRPLLDKAKTLSTRAGSEGRGSTGMSGFRSRSHKLQYQRGSAPDRRSIPLGNKGAGNHFEQLPDDGYDKDRSGSDDIVVTTNIRSTWEHV